MENREWTYYDKTKWPEIGPWTTEVDKTQFTDEATGLPCLTVRNHHGAWCGYVGVPKGHPFYGVEYSDDAIDVSVHGGLTFSDFCAEGEKEHGICHIPDPGEPDNVWWLGFDCGHLMDRSPQISHGLPADYYARYREEVGIYRDLGYVQEQCRRLAAQLAAVK